jgi:signal transduction histidine kinase/putative methionine-R-sulfoxide reductase with GAF domain
LDYRLKDRLEALFDVSRQLASVSRDLHQVLAYILNNVHKVMGASAASLMLKVEGQDELEFVQLIGDNTEGIQSKRLKFGESISGEAAQIKKMINVSDAYDHPRFDSRFDKISGFRTKQILTSPMLSQNEVVGVISVFNTLHDQDFSKDDERILKIFSDQASIAIMNAYSYGNLEKIIAERTRTISTILQNVQSGFFLIDRSLRVQEGYSKSCCELFGKEFGADQELVKLFDRNEEKIAFEVSCYQVFNDVLPERVSLDQIPTFVAVNGLLISLVGRVIRDVSGDIQHILFTANDTSNFVAAEEENERNRSLLVILQNKDSFIDFIKESKKLLASLLLDRPNQEQVKRVAFHTIKGNAGNHGLVSLAQLIHRIEDHPMIENCHIVEVANHLRGFLVQNFHILNIDFDRIDDCMVYNLSRSQIQALRSSVVDIENSQRRQDEFEKWIKSLEEIQASKLLRPLIAKLPEIARKGSKQVEVSVKGGETMVLRQLMLPAFQILVHILHNCIEHGIETEEDRVNSGKPRVGKVLITVLRTKGFYEISVKDDGRGIDLESLRKEVLSRGILEPHQLSKMSDREIHDLIFLDGLTTANKPTEYSGRGVGMVAVKEAIEKMNGSIRVNSQFGIGTEFSLVIPDLIINAMESRDQVLVRI